MASDIDALVGAPWVGTLTYLDYTSKKSVTIDSSLMVGRVGDAPPSWSFGYGYSREPHADSTSTLTLLEDGRVFGDEVVVSRARCADGGLAYTTESRGEDDQRAATFRFEHRLDPRSYSRRKLVRYDGEREYVERHVYRWSR